MVLFCQFLTSRNSGSHSVTMELVVHSGDSRQDSRSLEG